MSQADESGESGDTGLLAELRKFWARVKAVDLKPRQVQLEIDGVVYTNVKMPAGRGVDVGPRVMLIVAQSLAGGELGVGSILRVIERAHSEGVLGLARELLSDMQAGGDVNGPVWPKFDDHFAGEYEHLLRVLIFSAAHNFLGPTRGVR